MAAGAVKVKKLNDGTWKVTWTNETGKRSSKVFTSRAEATAFAKSAGNSTSTTSPTLSPADLYKEARKSELSGGTPSASSGATPTAADMYKTARQNEIRNQSLNLATETPEVGRPPRKSATWMVGDTDWAKRAKLQIQRVSDGTFTVAWKDGAGWHNSEYFKSKAKARAYADKVVPTNSHVPRVHKIQQLRDGNWKVAWTTGTGKRVSETFSSEDEARAVAEKVAPGAGTMAARTVAGRGGGGRGGRGGRGGGAGRPRPVANPYDGYTAGTEAYRNKAAALRSLIGQDSGLSGEELSAMFNFGEDPNAVAARDWALKNIAAQRDAGSKAIDTAYKAGAKASRNAALEELRIGDALGAQMAAAFSAGANGVQASNAQLAADAAAGAGALGVTGGVEGDAVDLGAVLAAAAPREQALAQQLGQIGASAQNAMATSMEGQRIAEQGSLQRSAAQMSGGIAAEYAQREAARIAAERSAWREAQMQAAARNDERNFALQQAIADADYAAGEATAVNELARRRFISEQQTADQARRDQLLQSFASLLSSSPSSKAARRMRRQLQREAGKALTGLGY